MGKSQETFNKKEKEKKRQKKRQEKAMRREERREKSEGGGLDAMMAYIDENGNIVDTPPDPAEKTEINIEDIDASGHIIANIDDSINKGKVTFFDDTKGFGFIQDASQKEKIFVHINNLLDPVKENDPVTFDLERGPKGLVALNVRKLG